MTTATLIERVPPHSLEAEMSVVGCMLLDDDAIALVLPLLESNFFYSRANQVIYETVSDLFEKGQPVDSVMLKDELKKKGSLEEVGGVDYIASLVEVVPSSANAVYYAQIVKDKAILRALITAANHILRDVYEDRGEASVLLDHCEKLVFDIAEMKIITESTNITDVLKMAMERIEKLGDREGRLTGLGTGLYDLDDMTSGLQDSELIVVAGRPSMGKTSFALNIAEYVGLVEEKPVVIFSLEMSKQQLAQNMLCSHARINAHSMRRGLLAAEGMQKLALAASTLSAAPIFIDDSTGLTSLHIKAKARRLKAQHDIRLVIVDYLQLIEGPPMDNRQQEVAKMSLTMKGLAKELDVPVLLVSQLSRAAEQREGHRPRMSDLRESGAIEQDADVVLLLHREELYNATPENKGRALLIVAKQRNGPVGNIELQFQSEYMRFRNLQAQM